MIQLYPEKVDLVNALAPIVTEEWGHFRLVLNELRKRNLELGRQRKDEYVNALLQFERKGGSRENRLIERLLVCALIEARSCERFRLLSLHIGEDVLKEFYHGFMISEAGHYRLFIDLANQYGDPEKVKVRWTEYLEHEAEIMASLNLRGDRIH